MYPMAVYVGKIERYLKSTIVISNGLGVRYVSGKLQSKVQIKLPDDFLVSSILYKLTDIKTKEDLEIHLLAQRLLEN
jgi:hypothetical protein